MFSMKLGANHPMGPLELGDFVGLDICLAIMDVLYNETGDRHLTNDPLIPTKNYHGAARLREKTPKEVAAERDARKITA